MCEANGQLVGELFAVVYGERERSAPAPKFRARRNARLRSSSPGDTTHSHSPPRELVPAAEDRSQEEHQPQLNSV